MSRDRRPDLPLPGRLNGVFFISVGMLLDLPFLVRHLPTILFVSVVVVVLKAICGARDPDPRLSLARFGDRGDRLAQIGESRSS